MIDGMQHDSIVLLAKELGCVAIAIGDCVKLVWDKPKQPMRMECLFRDVGLEWVSVRSHLNSCGCCVSEYTLK